MTCPGKGAIGVFDSGYGGLTILRRIRQVLPKYDYIFLGDNARAPYGTRSFDIVYRFTLEAVNTLFEKGCRLVILACNTGSEMCIRDRHGFGKGFAHYPAKRSPQNGFTQKGVGGHTSHGRGYRKHNP